MTNSEKVLEAKKFAEYWKGKGYEKGESQKFWLSLLNNVYGVKEPEKFIDFEDTVRIDNTSFIDGFIPSTHVLIEQKGLGKNLMKAIKQSDGSYLSPFQQAKRYASELPYSQRPRWIITSNFSSFLVYDMEKPTGEPEIILLENLPKEYYRLEFMVDSENENLKREMEVSVKAGEIVGKLYDEILSLYIDRKNENSLKNLNMLCVRLVFCLYAEDAGIFGKHAMFHDYLRRFEARDLRKALIELFKVLDTKIQERDKYIDKDLSIFPYVNGGLFEDEEIEIPQLNEKVKQILLENASENFNWSEISPTIFGAVFESTLNPETRRSGGMHYTSIENIHKVIDPLFLDNLKEELQKIKAISVIKNRTNKLKEFQKKIGKLNFLDPACGSGNFLTETYISLRKLENEIVIELSGGQIAFATEEYTPIQVSIGQFYGIEINDFAVTVAKTALWIAESQMMKETEMILHTNLEFLPLKSYANIIEGNALKIDWETVISKNKLSYIMGNPPFVGNKNLSKEQRIDIEKLFNNNKTVDYVCGWYMKASKYINGTNIECAFVSTNSITQGEIVGILWKELILRGIKINFAYKTFKWDSEASNKATVYCVIIGFSQKENKIKKIYIENNNAIKCNKISPYLIDSDNIIVESRNKPLCNIPSMRKGNQPTDGGNLIIEEKDYEHFIKNEPKAIKHIRKLVGADEFINNKNRYCLWLLDCLPNELRQMPYVMDRINKVRDMRIKSSDKKTREMANSPTLFRETNNFETFIIIPSVSSAKRKYIPIGFLNKETIPTNLVLIIPNATLYHFGILTSNVHMAWTRIVAGRLGIGYRYSKDIVYNNFPWPNVTKEQKEKIEKTAQAILYARKLYPDSSLADLYDEVAMPSELRKAHQQNDRAVMEAYGFVVKNEFTESMCVAELMGIYKELIEKQINSNR